MPKVKYGSGAFEKQKVRRKGVHAKSKNSYINTENIILKHTEDRVNNIQKKYQR